MELAQPIREVANPSKAGASVPADDPGAPGEHPKGWKSSPGAPAGDSDIFDRVSRRLASINDLAPGVRISDNIRLVSLLGTGGMANVWIAEHAGLDTRVAVKFMSGDLASDPECVARFGQEAKLAARIKSAHVVNILDPSVVVLGGGLSNIAALYGRGREAVARHVFNDELTTPIVQNALGDSAGVIGAALLTVGFGRTRRGT